MLRVLYDGWSLINQPLSPAGLHLLAILENLPADVAPVVALPGEAPEWFPETVTTHILPTEQGLAQRLRWEQRTLPGMLKETGARLLHMTTANPALFASAPTVVSPSGYLNRDHRGGLVARAREALSLGGMSRIRGIFWPADLSKPMLPAQVISLPPIVPSIVQTGTKLVASQGCEWDLSGTFILYHGPYGETDLRRLVLAWSWAAEPLGNYYPVYLLGIDEAAQERIPRLMLQYNVTGTFIPVPLASPQQLAQFYRRCAILFHPAEISPWGGAVRNALACARPIAALETQMTDEMVGNAAFLLPETDARAQGAALIAITGEDALADQLSNAARQRSASWDSDSFGEQLSAAYRRVLS